MLAVACSHPVTTAAGKQRADYIAARLPKHVWQRLSAGNGSKGQRFYDWTWITLDAERGGHRWLLIRRNTSTGELAFYRCYAPGPVPLATLVRIAGRRWTVEESFQTGRAWPGSTSIKSAAGPPGTGGPCSRCSLTHSWSCSRSPNAPSVPRPTV